MGSSEFRLLSWDDPLVREVSYDCGSRSVREAYAYIRAVAYRNRRWLCEALGDVGYYFGYFGKRHFRLVEIAVRSGEQGKGHGAAMLRRLVGRCRAEGAESVTLRCSIDEGNWPFYVRYGFCIVGRKQGDYELELRTEDYID